MKSFYNKNSFMMNDNDWSAWIVVGAFVVVWWKLSWIYVFNMVH